ncbi:MAG: S8 family peptidase [Chitinophagaceae bacterium]|nr:S8 family peptidase [Chitinophagaceae bacterium]
MQKHFFLIFFLSTILTSGYSQFSKRVVFFTDKNETPFSLTNPSDYLSARAVERRTKYNIGIDSTDLPLITRYVDSIVKAGTVTLLGRSRWLNAVLIQTNDANAIAKINSFPFVKSVSNIAMQSNSALPPDKFAVIPTAANPLVQQRNEQTAADTFNYGSSSNQIKIHKGEFLHNIGARGQGMMMAFLDAGFFGFQTNQFFDSARVRNQFMGTWDFVAGHASVNEDNAHGMQCFSTVGAYRPGVFVGSCPEAKYFLLRTEDAATEQIIEEYNWAMGAEYADSAGVDVISSSLGYTTFTDPSFNHTYADMNGNTTVVSRMADLAAKKGILIVNSAGNDGNSTWKYIGAPADGDSVLAVGAVNGSGIIASFSSYGPTSDGQIKPDVVSVGSGTTVSTINGTVGSSSGTSFSGPNMAGLATSLWQLFPEFNNFKIITTLHKASDKYTIPGDRYGYGLPNMKSALGILVSELSTMTASLTNLTTTLNWNSKDLSSMRYDIERKLPGEVSYTKIKTVPAAGLVFAARNYQTEDLLSGNVSGMITYRIQQVIDTAAATFTAFAIDSATVNLVSTAVNDLNNRSNLMQLFPNPVQSTIALKLNEERAIANISIQIFNAQGQLLLQEQYNKPTGTSIHNINVSLLSKGNYVMILRLNGKKYATKEFVKQ